MTDLGWSIDLTRQAAGNQPAAIENWPILNGDEHNAARALAVLAAGQRANEYVWRREKNNSLSAVRQRAS
jgi:hypothetical protein